MANKQNLPGGIYTNDEYPIHVKQIQDWLQSIPRYAKNLPDYKDKCKLESDKLIINGMQYGIDDIHKLSSDLATFCAAEKCDDDTIAFHGELSPCSNFHPSPFTINNETFHSAKQWIQYQKCRMFGDSYTANLVLKCETPLEANCLSYRVKGVNYILLEVRWL